MYYISSNISLSISSPPNERERSKIKVNGIDPPRDDLFQYMKEHFSPDISTKSSYESIKSSSKSKSEQNSDGSHHREKRFIWITKEKRIVLPPGTQLVLTPTLGKRTMYFFNLHHIILILISNKNL